MILLMITLTAEPFEPVYRIVCPGIPLNAVLPKAAPVQDGTVLVTISGLPVLVTLTVLRVMLKVDRSGKVKLNAWPAVVCAVASL